MQIPIAITGMGILSPFGCGVDVFSTALQKGETAIDFISPSDSESPIKIAANLHNFNYKNAISLINNVSEHHLKTALRIGHRAPIGIQTSITAAIEAWYQARLQDDFHDPARIGIIAAGNNTTTTLSYMHFQNYLQHPEYISPSYALHFLDTNQIGYLSELFTIHGEGYCVGGASASGNVAIIQAARLIQLGVIDVCLVVGIMAQLSPLELQALRNIDALGGIAFEQEPQKACRPFDMQHEGFIPGEASACLILEKMASAKERKVPIYGKYLGGAMYLDANRTPDPNREGEARAIERTLKEANLSLTEIDYINTHGTSSKKGDEEELAALHLVFKECLSKIWLNSTKGFTGHCLWSAGIVEAIATIIQINNNFVHANCNLDEPIDKNCRFAGKKLSNIKINNALSNSFAFGGINTCIALQRGEY